MRALQQSAYVIREQPETMSARQCSLCREAEKQPADQSVFFLKDINPRKPNRWLALPRTHDGGLHHLHDMSLSSRTALWTAAIDKGEIDVGRELGRRLQRRESPDPVPYARPHRQIDAAYRERSNSSSSPIRRRSRLLRAKDCGSTLRARRCTFT